MYYLIPIKCLKIVFVVQNFSRALKIGYISFSWRFKRFHPALVKNHARMRWESRCRGT